MRSSWYFRRGSKTPGARVAWLVFGLIVVMFYFTRRVVVALGVGGWSREVDVPVYDWLAAHQVPALQAASRIMYWWGATPGMTATMIILTTWLCLARRTWWPLATVAVAAVGSVGMTLVLKGVFAHARPVGLDPDFPPPQSCTFPSGHTLNAAALIGVIGYLAIVHGLYRWRWWLSILAGLFILAMGASRIYLGHHWVSDVLVGLLIGLGWGAIVAIGHFYFVPRPPWPPVTVPRRSRHGRT